MDIKAFMVFLTQKLQQEFHLTEQEAIFETQSILNEKRQVQEGQYAVFITKEQEMSIAKYFKRTKEQWVLDKSVDENVFVTTTSDFCNTNDSCVYNLSLIHI